jgi:hypothetical protein
MRRASDRGIFLFLANSVGGGGAAAFSQDNAILISSCPSCKSCCLVARSRQSAAFLRYSMASVLILGRAARKADGGTAHWG